MGKRLTLLRHLRVLIVAVAALMPLAGVASTHTAQLALLGHHGVWLGRASADAPEGQALDLDSRPVASAFDDRRGALWVLTEDRHLVRFDSEGASQADIQIPERTEATVASDKHQHRWTLRDLWEYIWALVTGHDYDPGKEYVHLPMRVREAALAVDKQSGDIWISAEHALYKYSADGALKQALRLHREARYMTVEWTSGALWLASHDGVRVYAPDAQTHTDLDLGRHAHVGGLALDEHDQSVWIALHRELKRYGYDGKLQTSLPVEAKSPIAPDGNGGLWLFDRHGLVRVGQDGEEQRRPDLGRGHHRFASMASDLNNGSLWLLARDRLLQVSPDGTVTVALQKTRGRDHDRHDGHDRDDRGHDRDDHGHDRRHGHERHDDHDRGKHHDSGDDDDSDDSPASAVFRDIRPATIVINGDINPPSVEWLGPKPDDMVGPRPELDVHAEDIGVGVDLSTALATVGDNTVDLNCQLASNGAPGDYACQLQGDLTQDPATLSVTLSDYAGNTASSGDLTLKLDSDGDGHRDQNDTYPHDPSRWRLAAVKGVTPALADTAVRITWQPEDDKVNTAGYRVFRTVAGSDQETQLTQQPVNALEYRDAEVENGTGYTYRVEAVDTAGRPGAPGEGVPFFVAYNHSQVSDLSVGRQKVSAQLHWTGVDNASYQVYRAIHGGEAKPLVRVDDTAYLDTTPLWSESYDYRLATIYTFHNPFTDQDVDVLGPKSPAVTLPKIPPLTLALANTLPGDDGVPQLLMVGSTVDLTGRYGEALGPVTVTAKSGDKSLNQTDSDGTFRLRLPAQADTVWTVTVSENTVPDRAVSQPLRLIEDTEPPKIVIDPDLKTKVTDDHIELRGTVVDKLSGVAGLYARSDRYGTQQFALIRGNGAFHGEVPLEHGDNKLTVTAVDKAGNQAQATATVARAASEKPTLVITAPAPAAQLTTDHVDLSGVVYTSLPKEKIRISLGGDVLFPESGDDVHGYPFTFAGIRLQPGANDLQVTVETPAGKASADVTVNYAEPTPQEPPPDPEIEITSPTTNTTVNGTSTTITGTVTGDGVTVTINGEVVETNPDGDFSYTLDLTDCSAGNTVTIVVTDSHGNQTTRTVTLDCDRDAPVINLDAGYPEAPAVTRVLNNPLMLEGTVSDAHLGGLSVAGQTVDLQPAAGNSYRFSAALQLPIEIQQSVSLQAWDSAGNTTSRNLIFQAANPLKVEFIAPHEGAEIGGTDDGSRVDVVARIHGLQDGQVVTVSADNGPQQAMRLDGNMAVTQLLTSENSGSHAIAVQVADANGTVLARSVVNIELNNADDVPVNLLRTEPANSEAGISPNAPIVLYFNKHVDPDKLNVTVKETQHGKDYDLSNQVGAGFTRIPDPKLVQIDHDMQPIMGAIQTYPSGRIVTFTPTHRLGYGAHEYLTVQYDGQEMKRFSFQVQALPTIIAGTVSDEKGDSVKGLTVQMPDFDLATKTDSNGNFSFGAGADVKAALPSGKWRLVVNPGMQDPAYGSEIKIVEVVKSRVTTLRTIKTPFINRNTPFVSIGAGNSNSQLAGGDLKLDLSQARLVFPGSGASTGNVHIEFLTMGQYAFPVTRGAVPQWLYNVQPSGIKVDGAVSVQFQMPKLYGSDLYIPHDGTLVALMGLNPSTGLIEPIGVGEIQGHTVRSVTPIHPQRLDYLGYAFVSKKGAQVLADYKDGKIANLAALRSALVEAVQ